MVPRWKSSSVQPISASAGIYIQANNALVFRAPEAAALFARVFDIAFEHSRSMSADPIFKQWHLVQLNDKPPIHFCFSPHQDSDLSLSPLGAAIDQVSSVSGKPAWFEKYYVAGSQAESDRKLFSH